MRMSRDDIDKALRRILDETGQIAKNPLAGQDARVLAASVALLAAIIGEQEKRL